MSAPGVPPAAVSAGPTPAGPGGAPLAVPTALLAGVRARLAADPSARERILEEFWAAHPRTPVAGATRTRQGVVLRETTFLWRGEPGRGQIHDVMLHINSLNDRHRENIEPALLAREPGTDIWHLTYLLPPELIASYRLVIGAGEHGPLPRSGGHDRAHWMRIHALGAPDPRNPGALRNPLGTASSVLTLDAARPHPAWGEAPFRRGSTVQVYNLVEPDGSPRRVWIYRPLGEGGPGKLLVLFDGEVWREIGIQDALDRWAGPGIAVVLVSSMGSERRGADLPVPERVATLLEHTVLPAARAALGHEYRAADIIASGQSYGGLAAAGLLITRPDLVGSAVAQSASFHYREGEALRREETRPGTLSDRLAREGASGRMVLTVGLEEGILLDQARLLVRRAARTGLGLTYREVRGGHDYAWWRHGLLDGLDELAAEW